MAEKNITNPTKEQIEAWKKEYAKQHLEVHKLVVGDKVAYIHSPDLDTLDRATNLISKGSLYGGVRAVLDNCWLAGDTDIKVIPNYLMGAANIIDKLIDAKHSELEKL